MFLFPPLRRPWARLWGHRAERGGVKGGTAPAPMTVDPRQWSAGGSGTGEFSARKKSPGSKSVREGSSEVAAFELGS